MKRLRKNLEEKDEMEEKLRVNWMELKAAARNLPAGRTEKEGLAKWAEKYSLKQFNEYTDKKSSIIQSIRKWENKSSIVIDSTKDVGRIAYLVSDKIKETSTLADLEETWMEMTTYMRRCHLSKLGSKLF